MRLRQPKLRSGRHDKAGLVTPKSTGPVTQAYGDLYALDDSDAAIIREALQEFLRTHPTRSRSSGEGQRIARLITVFETPS